MVVQRAHIRDRSAPRHGSGPMPGISGNLGPTHGGNDGSREEHAHVGPVRADAQAARGTGARRVGGRRAPPRAHHPDRRRDRGPAGRGRPAGRRVLRRAGQRHRRVGHRGPDAGSERSAARGRVGENYGVPYGTGWTSADEAKLPTLEIWEDFQCPACKQVEAASGAQIQALADEGKVKLLYRPATFLDVSLAADNQANGNPNSSARATSAWGCAIDAGKTGEYHSAVFDIQPAEEGVGYSDQQLIDLGTTVGIDGRRPGDLHQVRPGRHLPGLVGEQQPGVRRRRRRAGRPRPTSTAWSSTAPTLLTSRDSRRRSKPRPRSDRRAGHLDPESRPVGLAPRPAAAAGVRAVHPGRASSSPCGSATGAGSPAVGTRAWSTTSPSGRSRSGSSAGGSTTS